MYAFSNNTRRPRLRVFYKRNHLACQKLANNCSSNVVIMLHITFIQDEVVPEMLLRLAAVSIFEDLVHGVHDGHAGVLVIRRLEGFELVEDLLLR